MRAVVAGGGLVGLTAAAALKRDGWEVLVAERAPAIRAAGAGIGLWGNALAVLDTIGLRDELVRMGTTIDTWFFDACGRRVRADGYEEQDHQFTLVPRAPLNDLLADAVGRSAIRTGTAVTGYAEGDGGVAVRFDDGHAEQADLLIAADGVNSAVRAQLLPGSEAVRQQGHYAWRAVVPAGGEDPAGTVLTIGGHRTRGGYSRLGPDRTMWMVNQFDSPVPTGTKREQAVRRAHDLNENGWHDELIRMIGRTPEESILLNQITIVPPLPRWTSGAVALVGDAAHALSPHISAGGTLGIEDIGVLCSTLRDVPELPTALARYEAARIPRYEHVRELSAAVEHANGALDFATQYVRFSHWMRTTAPSWR